MNQYKLIYSESVKNRFGNICYIICISKKQEKHMHLLYSVFKIPFSWKIFSLADLYKNLLYIYATYNNNILYNIISFIFTQLQIKSLK